MYDCVSSTPVATISTSTMIGRACPCHVARIDGGTGRVRAFLITSPETRGTVSVAFRMQASLFSARLAVATSVSEAATAILMNIGRLLGPEPTVYLSKLDRSKTFGPEQPKRVESCHVRFGSTSRHPCPSRKSPLYPRKPTLMLVSCMSALGHNRTHAPQQRTSRLRNKT